MQLFMKRKLYLILLISSWVLLSGRLIYQTYYSQSTPEYLSLETGLRQLPSESEWMNIYHAGHKMGYTVYTINNRGTLGYSIKSASHLKVVFGGLASDIHLENTARLDTLFRLERFSFKMLSEQYTTKILGEKKGTVMTLQFIQGRDTSISHIDVPQDLYTYTAIQPMIASKGILEGETIRVPAYDPMSNKMADVTITHTGKEYLDVAGSKMILNKLKLEFKGIPSIMWLDDNGVTYKEETIMGMTMERTTAELALAQSNSPDVDLLNGFAVIPNHRISRPEKLKELVIELSDIAFDQVAPLVSSRQQIIQASPLTLKLRPRATPLIPGEQINFLRSTSMIQSEHQQIKDRSKEILKGTPLEEREAILTKWVYGYLEKRPVASISSAVDILNTGIGDCTEHTTLYSALSRAAGIPTKVHIGLVYVQGRFLFHAWPVVAINGKWVDVDPSLNQFPADATHIALLESDFENLTDLIPVLGNIEIKILEQRY